jgi:hypothetical protein
LRRKGATAAGIVVERVQQVAIGAVFETLIVKRPHGGL